MQQTQQAPRSTEKVCVSELPYTIIIYMSKLIRFGHNMVLSLFFMNYFNAFKDPGFRSKN